MGDHTYSTTLIAFLILFSLAISQTFGFEPCPPEIRSVCDCFYPFFTVRCSHKELNEYPDFYRIQVSIQKLDVSFNNLRKFPAYLHGFKNLEILDLSHNQIDFLANDILLPDNLHTLILSYNNISSWLSITSNSIFESALNLQTLNLAGNSLGAFNGNDERLRLMSRHLKTLDLSNCQINKIIGPQMLTGLIGLEHLILRANPLHTLPDLFADNLLSIDLSLCNLTALRSTVFSRMPKLLSANFSENKRLTLVHRNEVFVESTSLREIDLTKCNMNAVELKGFPNVTTVRLNGNLITELHDDTFQNNSLIENLDLSENSISRISFLTFRSVQRLRSIDLSLNMIRQIDYNTFALNLQLKTINLSRNYIDRFRHFACPSLTYLNMSHCEITKIDENALNDLPELIELDLSYNSFSVLPAGIGSHLLQILDLRKCRLSHIDNETFAQFPELSRLYLAGNRLTTTFRTAYFKNNQYLNDIWLGDNPWRCECDTRGQDFYYYITERPSRLKDMGQFRCFSPGNANGVPWEVACAHEWDVSMKKATMVEKIWISTMSILIVIAILFSAVKGLTWWIQYRKEICEEQQRQENLETTRELMRQNQIILDQESQLNAPDPRETSPPCYDDAIRMPRLDSSFYSLKHDNFASSESIRRAAKRSRCRSEEVLSYGEPRRHILTARTRKNTLPRTWDTNAGHSSTSVADLIHINAVATNASSCSSFRIIEQLETEDGQSPYAKRRPQINTTSFAQIDSSSASSSSRHRRLGSVQPHYSSEDNLAASESSAASKPLFTSNDTFDSTSSSSSLDSKNYSQLSRSFEFQHSNAL